MALRIAVIGHVEHVTLGRVPSIPRPGEIAHLNDPLVLPGGGGGIAFHQLTKSDAEIHLFTALGNDEAARFVGDFLLHTRAVVHAASRPAPHTRDVVMIDPGGERTIVVVGEPHHPNADDPLPWHLLSSCDAVYFTAQDPRVLVLARAAKKLLVTARRRQAIVASSVKADVIVGSAGDPRETSSRADYPVPPVDLVMTEGPLGGRVENDAGTARFTAPHVEKIVGGAYGAGDSFAAALTYYVASGHDTLSAAQHAAEYGAAVLFGMNPLPQQRGLSPLDKTTADSSDSVT